MFCTQCGNELEEHAKFCSRCGKDLAPAVPAPAVTPRDWNMHINILGWLFVGTAVLTGLLGMMMMFGGQIVSQLPMWIPDAQPNDVPFDVLRFAGSMAKLIGLFTLALAAGIAASGIGLLQYRDWARVLGVIMCVLMALNFPLGTAVGIYGLWILLSEQGRTYYQSRTTQPRM